MSTTNSINGGRTTAPQAHGSSPSVAQRFRAGVSALFVRLWSGLQGIGRAFASVFRWPTTREGPLGISAIALWLMVFTAGMAVNSSAFTSALEQTVKTLQLPLDPIGRFMNLVWGLVLLVLVLFTYTASNVAILCLLSAEIGVFASRMYDSAARGVAELPLLKSRYLAALTGGFLIYLVVMSGSYTLLSLPFQTPPVGSSTAIEAQNQYKTLATLASIACLIEGFQPFAIPTVNRWLRGKSGADQVPSASPTQIVSPGVAPAPAGQPANQSNPA